MSEHVIDVIVQALRDALGADYEITATDYAEAAAAVSLAFGQRSCQTCGVVMADPVRHQAFHNGVDPVVLTLNPRA